MWICQHCNNSFEFINASQKANHSRWCSLNPKRNEYIENLIKKNNIGLMIKAKQKSGISNQFVKAKWEGKPIQHSMKNKKQIHPFKHHTEETKQHLRDKALASNHRRLRKGMVEYKGIMLDSSWELELAKRLDSLEIKWIRPKPLKWQDSAGDYHNYFPDFYLEDFNLFLDPKNPAAYENQKEKIIILHNTYSNIKILRTLDECKNFNMSPSFKG